MRLSRAKLLIATALLVAAGAGAVALALSGGHHGVVRAQELRPSGRVRRIGPLSHGAVGFTLNLRLHQREIDAYLRHVNPGGAWGPRLTASAFGSRFGLSDPQLASLRQTLSRLGIVAQHLYPQRTAMRASASVDQLQRVFGLRFDRFQLPDGRRYVAPERPPRIPAALAPYVTSLGDLSNRPIAPADIPAKGLTPSVVSKAYDIAPLWSQGFRGQGQTIAIASADGAVNPEDIRAFASQNGIANPQIQVVPVDGGTAFDPNAVGPNGEVDLDLQVTLGIAPAARIIDYQGSLGSSPQLTLGHSLADIYNRVEQDGQARIVSTSYGICEAMASPGDQQLADNALKALEASGVTVFIATGDTGAYACLQAQQIQPASSLPSGATSLSVQTPADSPYAVSVGGTRVELRSDGAYLTESAWSDPIQRSGGGGGVSENEPRPAWQQGPGVNQPSINRNGRRQLPDVSGPADPSSGFEVCQTQPGQSTPQCAAGNGGTSAAAPFWAASMLLVQQYAAAHGAGPLARCFSGPILYDIAGKGQPVPPFHQVTVGNNGFYSAGPEWNFATGLGSPDVFNLAQDYAAFLRARPAHTCPF